MKMPCSQETQRLQEAIDAVALEAKKQELMRRNREAARSLLLAVSARDMGNTVYYVTERKNECLG